MVIYRDEYRLYNFGPEHPFSPLRLEMLLSLLQALGAWREPVPPPEATREEILSVHSERLVRRVEAASRGERVPDLDHYGLGTSDTPVFPGMDRAARILVGGTLEGARRILSGEKRVLQLGGGLHHAQYDRASGFCVYNDLSVAIRHLSRAGLRVAYLDIDVHHGDGVQWIHYEEGEVLTLSLHESGRYLFPGTGHVHEIGRGEGVGRKLNLPLEPFTEDESYLEVFEALLPWALKAFRPDVLVVQAGADAHYLDPLADLLLTTRAYARLFPLILEYAEAFAGGRVLFTLGGGYNLDATVRVWTLLYHAFHGLPLPERLPEEWLRAWEARLGQPLTPTLHDPPDPYPPIPRRPEIEKRNRLTLGRLTELVGSYLLH
ncbi:MAG: acetoin utilization protein AcuC [Thermus sp.]|uniref:acetoin utilization protein AcuC n=1 Tax=Thermus sp. TaxID=275 RepID=UPI0025E14FE0|nr:acetoin utilization protein AcuC [Thermus sp.]MCS6868335.1 acetoin utilization protein AcuC [Thermus sp.]MCS7218165.1 acetoin utilization protein AcuC [Thermus sp.]MCX7850012.1 acetoin utilization protein AcuC [Thermus sp.]MDW8017576.1 acetoin utilization protein AcuC [Thermus sp.]MDW8356391.1 acetoin utilization protein AcuC [Thermus sp.]